jgi:hypothetical protein
LSQFYPYIEKYQRKGDGLLRQTYFGQGPGKTKAV